VVFDVLESDDLVRSQRFNLCPEENRVLMVSVAEHATGGSDGVRTEIAAPTAARRAVRP
jgi:hypothetical protein